MMELAVGRQIELRAGASAQRERLQIDPPRAQRAESAPRERLQINGSRARAISERS